MDVYDGRKTGEAISLKPVLSAGWKPVRKLALTEKRGIGTPSPGVHNSTFMENRKSKRKKLTRFQVIILGFIAVILVGTIVLMLPVSSNSGLPSSFECALFTATSAVCVTGLVVEDTATYWSPFGQAAILVLIQIGGLGVVTVASAIEVARGKKLTLEERGILEDSLSAFQVGGMVKLIRFIIRIVILTELVGAAFMMPVFCSQFGVSGVWMSVFHSVSAFCNAGFDLMGTYSGKFSSLTAFSGNPGVIIPICVLIVLGGIGFLTWNDVITYRRRIKRYRLQTKVVLAITAILIVVPALLYFIFEFSGSSLGERFALSVFQAITPRTAGFNTADLTKMTGAGIGLMIVLMLVGGSPGSTAGGMKTTTLAVLAANALSVIRRKRDAEIFGRRLEESAIRNASTLLVLYCFLSFASAAAISLMEGLSLKVCLFETASAIGTVGITMGITPSLGIFSHLILILLMFLGRVGGLTMMYAALSERPFDRSRRPIEKINVG